MCPRCCCPHNVACAGKPVDVWMSSWTYSPNYPVLQVSLLAPGDADNTLGQWGIKVGGRFMVGHSH